MRTSRSAIARPHSLRAEIDACAVLTSGLDDPLPRHLSSSRFPTIAPRNSPDSSHPWSATPPALTFAIIRNVAAKQ